MANRNHYQVIERRRWADIRPIWPAHIPELTDVGQPPDPTLSDFFSLSQVRPDAQNNRLVAEGVHRVALTEAIFLFQKSVHVARAVEASSKCGMLSWAVFQGYHSAYYAAKGVLSLLGVCFPQPEGRQLIVDLFPAPSKAKTRTPNRVSEILLAGCPKLEQKLLWGFFGRLLRVTEFPAEYSKHVQFLGSINHESIPRPRNRFIYHEDHWPYEDLTALRRIADFARRESLESDLSEVDEDSPLFLIVLGMVVPSLLRLMFDDLRLAVPAIDRHITYMDGADWLQETRLVRSYF